MYYMSAVFLGRDAVAMLARYMLSSCLSVRLYVCRSIRHKPALYQTQDHANNDIR